MGINKRGILWGIFYGWRAAIFIGFGERLTPDTRLYSSGEPSFAWISSPVCSLAGILAGYQGVCLAGIVGSFALGTLVGSYSRRISTPAILAFSPPGWYTIQPAADSLGAAAIVVSSRYRFRWFIVALLAAFHLEAALVFLGAKLLGRFAPIRLDIAATGMGAIACLGEWHFQARYFLPGLALLTASALRTFWCKSSTPSTTRLMQCSYNSAFPSRRSLWERWHYSQY